MRIAVAVSLVLAAVALAPAAASASTVILRPSATTVKDSPWTVTPSTATADAVLDDAVLQPAAPPTASDLLTAGTGNGAWVGLTYSVPALPADPTAVTGWFYNSVGTGQTLTVSLWNGIYLLGYSVFPAGQTVGWHSLSLSSVPTAAHLAGLWLSLRTDGTAGASPTRVYASYLQVDVPDDPASAPAAGQPVGAEPGTQALPGLSPGGTTTSPLTPLGKALQADSPLHPASPPVTIAAPATVDLPAAPKDVPVALSCPADSAGTCHGHAVLELIGAAPGKRARARAARCARGCRVIGESSFSIAAGKRKPVRIAMRPTAVRLLPHGQSVRARLTVTSSDGTHANSTASRVITLRRG